MKTFIACLAAACAISLTGCNTIAGAGRDIERGGEKLQDASAKVRADWRAARDKNERDYDAARAACSSGPQSERDACRDRARAAYVARVNELRSQSGEDRREEAYEAAREKCDAFRGAEEDRCVADARARYRR